MQAVSIYKYRVVGGDFKNPTTHDYQEGDFEIESTRSDLEDCSDDFRSYSLIGKCGEYVLDDRWKSHHGGGYTDGRQVIDNLDDLAAFTASEGVQRRQENSYA